METVKKFIWYKCHTSNPAEGVSGREVGDVEYMNGLMVNPQQYVPAVSWILPN